MSEKIRDEHRQRSAAVYIRQSTMGQVLKHQESQKLQYALAGRARELGFHRVEVIDEDLAISGSGLFERPGFQRLVSNVCTGKVGAILSIEVSRLARNGREWHHLIDLCGLFGTLVIDTDGVYDPRLSQDRLCRGEAINLGEGGCISFGGLRPDQAVSSMLLDVVQPTAVDAALEAAARVSQEDVDGVRAVSLELEQARYEAGLASRRYEAADPENRLVAEELEARWNAALARVRGLESRLEEARLRPRPTVTVDRNALLALAMNLPTVWNSEAADMKLKQRIVRTLIQEIIADVDEHASEIVLVIHWVGGRHTEVRTPKVKTGEHRRVTGADALALVRRMAGRWPDQLIAATLNRLGLRTGTGMSWIQSRVATVRQRLGLPAHDPEVNGPSTITLQQACQRLGVSNTLLRKLIKSKQLPALQAVPAAPWEIPVEALESDSIRQAVERARVGRSRWRRRAADRWTLSLPNTEGAEG